MALEEIQEEGEKLAAQRLDLIAKAIVEGFITGLHKSPFHGFSVEFAEHRIYNPGESIKSVDWKLYGRTDKLFVKRYEEETNLRCQIVIDTSSSMYYPKSDFNKLRFSVYSAAALINLLKKQRDAFGLSTFNERLILNTPCKGTVAHQQLIFYELEKLIAPPAQKTTSITQSLDQIADSIHKRSLVIVFSDFFENALDQAKLFQSLQHLKHNKHEIILFNVLDKADELQFDFNNRPYLFVDMETGKQLKVDPVLMRERYTRQVYQNRDALIVKCAQHQIDFVDADISQGYDKILGAYLIKRKNMGA